MERNTTEPLLLHPMQGLLPEAYLGISLGFNPFKRASSYKTARILFVIYDAAVVYK